jgi:hypothetical protein
MYNSQGVCVCLGVSTRKMSKETVEKRIILMLVAGAIVVFAILLVRLSWAIYLTVIDRVRGLRRRRRRRRGAVCGGFLRAWFAGALQKWRCGGCARRAFRGVAWDRRLARLLLSRTTEESTGKGEHRRKKPDLYNVRSATRH